MKRLAETEKPRVGIPLVLSIVEVEVPVVGVAVEVGHLTYRISSIPPPFEFSQG